MNDDLEQRLRDQAARVQELKELLVPSPEADALLEELEKVLDQLSPTWQYEGGRYE